MGGLVECFRARMARDKEAGRKQNPSDRRFLGGSERCAAGGAALIFFTLAGVVGVWPPARTVVLPSCPDAPAPCTAVIDGDLSTFAIAIAAIGSVAALVALLGVRFTSITAGSIGLGSEPFDQQSAGLGDGGIQSGPREALPPAEPTADPARAAPDPSETAPTETVAPSIAITRLPSPMSEVTVSILREYQAARRACQRGYFLTHILGPPTTRGQAYSVAVKVIPHRSATHEIRSVTFYLGRSWSDRKFPGRKGSDGNFGITTQAYGPFLALCEIEFVDGVRILLDHYCDFEMGDLVPH